MSTESGKQRQTNRPASSAQALRQLLDELQSLMREIRRRVCEDRRRYLASHTRRQISHPDVGEIIDRYVTACAHRRDETNSGCNDNGPRVEDAAPSGPVDTAPRLQIDLGAAVNTELSGHFHRNGHSTVLPSPVAERFKHSAWDHIHAAIRLAKADDAKGARLHSQLADNALKEAARYMKDEEYQRFMEEFEASLQRIANGPDHVE